MRQYKIFYKRGGSKFAALQPGVHSTLYDKMEVQVAERLLRENVFVDGISVHVEDEQFNLIAFDQEAEAPNSFKL